MFKVSNDSRLDKKTKKSLALKIKNAQAAIQDIEKSSSLSYPAFYVEPVLPVAQSNDNVGGLGVLYARTIPVDLNGRVEILVELSAPLLLYATKVTLRLVLAHEFLHYLELVKNFTRLDIVSQISSSSIYEERFSDSSRALDPSKVFSSKKLVSELKKKTSAGLDDEKLNEKCRTRWIEKKMPVARISLDQNQTRISVESIMRSQFDERVKQFLSKIG